MADPQKYRDEAKRLRLHAATVVDSEIQRQMISVATQYEQLARIEARKKDPW
ncbi:MAG: hypothetical protein JWL84_326 [Rhodospirillales bacterium]|jgi:hypothetical protein|nr:hypothetical protein [Rhodospirillales bacterium]